MKPLANNVIVRPDTAPNKTETGLYLPETSESKPTTGKIIEVGPKVENITVGDTVLFQKYSGTDIEFKGDKLKIFDADNILAVIN